MAHAIETERKLADLLHPSPSPVAKWMTSDSVTSRALAVLQACSSSSDEEDNGGCNSQITSGSNEGTVLKDPLHRNGLVQGERLSKNSTATSKSQGCSVDVDALNRSTRIHTASNINQISSHGCGDSKDHRKYDIGKSFEKQSQRTEPLLWTEGEREILQYNKDNLNEDLVSNFSQRKEIFFQETSPNSTKAFMARQSAHVTKNTELSTPISKKRRCAGGMNHSTAAHSSRITSVASSRSPNKKIPSKLVRSAERMAHRDIYSSPNRLTRKASASSSAMQQKYLEDDVEDVCPHDLESKYGDILSIYLSTPFDSRAMKSLYQSKEFNKDDDTTTRYEGNLKIMSQKKFLNMKKDVLADAMQNDLLEEIESSIGLHSSKNRNS